MSVICLESVLFHLISIRTNILGPESLRTCPEAIRNVEPEILFD